MPKRYDTDGTGPWYSGRELDALMDRYHGYITEKPAKNQQGYDKDPETLTRPKPTTIFCASESSRPPARSYNPNRGTRGKKG